MKKTLAIILTLVLMVSVLPFGLFTITASAATSGYYTYTVSNGEATITDVSTSISGAVTIPSTLGGYPVTSIGDDAFYNCSRLTSITIPDSVTSIGVHAFQWCYNLTSITIGDSVTSIGNIAFYNCKSLTSITIPDSVTSIGNSAFSGCSSLESITVDKNNKVYHSDGNCLIETSSKTLIAGCKNSVIPSDGSVTSIGDYAFKSCTSLTSITIPDSVMSIGDQAFMACSALTSITIGDSVTSIRGYAFYNTAYYNNSTNWENDVLYLGKHLIKANTSISGTYKIKDGTLTIAEGAFSNCTSLTSITIPDSVASIGDEAFYSCESLTSITIPDSVTSIDDLVFYNCTSLTSITIPDSVTSIGDEAFSSCENLTSITIGDSVTSIGSSAFEYCTSLTSITIPDSVTSIGGRAFRCCRSLENITLSDSISNIGYMAFLGTGYFNNSANWIGDFLYIDNYLVFVNFEFKDYYVESLVVRMGTLTIAEDCFNFNAVVQDGSIIETEIFSIGQIILPNTIKNINANVLSTVEEVDTVYYGGTEAQWNAISIGENNDPLLNAELKCAAGMVSEGSVRHEGIDENGNYQSAGIRFKSRISSDFRKSASELGFVAVPTALLGNMTIAEYVAQPDNQALTAKVKGNGIKEIIYAVSTNANGQKYYDYQMMIKGLTREGVAENLLDTDITVAMYAIVDGETIYTETMSYSYNWFVAQTTK